MKNTMSKTRPISHPYETWFSGNGWTWLVLKKYQADDHKPYARWFCAVYSPFLPSGEFELGDCYAAEIMQQATKLEHSPTATHDEKVAYIINKWGPTLRKLAD